MPRLVDPPAMSLRDARPADAEAIADVARASWHAAYDDLLGAEAVDHTVGRWYAPDSLRERLSRTAGRDDAVFLVADVDDEVIAFADAGPADADDPADAFFSRLYVHPRRWGEGVGTELTAAVCGRLREASYDSVWLEVFEANGVGRSFYESLGFERVGSVEETFGGTTLTTLHLRASLSTLLPDAGATPSDPSAEER